MEQCDDGNLIAGDGCSPTCTIEIHWSCVLNSAMLSVCTPIPQINMTITLASTIKSPTSNSVVFTFDISPVIPALNSLDFSQAITCDLNNTASSLDYSYNGNGVLTLTANYNSSLQGQNIALQFDPSLVSSAFEQVLSSNLSFTVAPDNNLPATVYDDGTY